MSGDLVLLENRRVDLTDGADRVAAGEQSSRTRWMQPDRDVLLVDSRTSAEGHGELTPHGDRRRGFGTGQHDTEHLAFVGQLTGTRRVHVTDLVERHVRAAMGQVVGDRSEQTGSQRRTQDVLVGNEWVGDPQHRPVDAAPSQVVVGEERRRHDLRHAEAEQHLADLATSLLSKAEMPVQRGERHTRSARSRTRSAGRSLR